MIIKIYRNSEFDETVAIIDDHNKAKSILDKWEVKLKSKLRYDYFDMAVIAKGKDLECVGCIYALRLMTQPPCSECKKSEHLYFTKENPMDWPEFKNCYNCKHRNKLVTEEPCHTCLSQDNEITCWEFKCCPCARCGTVKSATVCCECESHHWMYYEVKES